MHIPHKVAFLGLFSFVVSYPNLGKSHGCQRETGSGREREREGARARERARERKGERASERKGGRKHDRRLETSPNSKCLTSPRGYVDLGLVNVYMPRVVSMSMLSVYAHYQNASTLFNGLMIPSPLQPDLLADLLWEEAHSDVTTYVLTLDRVRVHLCLGEI